MGDVVNDGEKERSLRGAIFCHVASKIQEAQGRAFITLGNQKCPGGTPNLMSKPKIVINVPLVGVRVLPISRRVLPVAWDRKYLVAASASWCFVVAVMRGIKDKRFTSSPSQARNQEGAATAIRVPEISVSRNIVWKGKKEIIKG